MTLRVLRVSHSGRDPGQRLRERALTATGVEVTLAVPAQWPGSEPAAGEGQEDFSVVQLPVRRPGDINGHRYRSTSDVRRVVERVRPDLIDVHEEPFSLSLRQWLAAARGCPVVAYTAQNVDKRFPPPFAQYERTGLQQLRGLYPCTRQAASVARGKGFRGPIEVLPLGYDDAAYAAGTQRADDDEIVLGLVGRLVPEKGLLDAVRVLAAVRRVRPARLLVVGAGPEGATARRLAAELDVASDLEMLPWQPAARMAELYRGVHVLLLPSRATQTWTEQFGRVMIEAQASGAVVVGYRSGAIGEVAAGTAVLVPEGEVEALAAATLDLLADASRLVALRQAGLVRVARMSWRLVAQQQRAFYERVLSGAPPSTLSAGTPAARRAAASREFGPPAVLAGGADRPFALPVLRRDRPWTRALGTALDAAQSQPRRISRS